MASVDGFPEMMDIDDESDFYGSPTTVETWNKRANAFDVPGWIAQHHAHPNHPPTGFSAFSRCPTFNAYAGIPYAWQLSESLGDFLDRLPPATTPQSPSTPWIYIYNPFASMFLGREPQSLYLPPDDDPALNEVDSAPQVVAEGGLERLQLMADFTEGLRLRGGNSSIVARDITQARKQAVADILNLAQARRVRTGKWMLFCSAGEVNDVWSAVARATAFNQLGVAAKVAPRPEHGDPQRDRLICVYTQDFSRISDVGRVLQRLRELRLVEARGKPIYYKPDAFTHIGIASNNPWGIRASIYSSNDF